MLDNCEHVLDGAARLVATLLSATSRVRVLATSRAPLGVGAEQVWPLPPLSSRSEALALQVSAWVPRRVSVPWRRLASSLDTNSTSWNGTSRVAR